MKNRFIFITLLLSVFLLSFSGGCKEERKRDRNEESEQTREYGDPPVKEMEEWADGACACENIDCITKAGNDLLAKTAEMEDKKLTEGEYHKIKTSIARGTKCIKDNTAKYAANAGGGAGGGGLTTKQESAPKATPLNKEVLTELLKTPIEGMEAKRQDIRQDAGFAWYHTPTNEKKLYLEVKVTAQYCMVQFFCPELTLAGFESRRDQLMQGILGKKHLSNPAHIFALSAHEYDGKIAIGTHAVSYYQEGSTSSHVSFFRLLSHDGTNLLMAEAKPKGPWPKSQEDLAAMASKEEMQAAAEAAFKAYAPKLFQK